MNGPDPNGWVQQVSDLLWKYLGPKVEQSIAIRPRVLNVKQAALYLGRSESAVRQLAGMKALPTVRADSRVMFDVRDLDCWIEQNKS